MVLENNNISSITQYYFDKSSVLFSTFSKKPFSGKKRENLILNFKKIIAFNMEV